LKMFSKNKVECKKKYLEFVLKKTPEEINRIFGGKKWPAIIGSDDFINRTKKNFFNKKRHMEVPESKLLAPDIEKIKTAVCKEYKLKEEELHHSKRGSRNEARDTAIYLSRQLRGSKLTEIGKEFGISNYSTVSTIIERIKIRMSKERTLNKRVVRMIENLKMSQQQT